MRILSVVALGNREEYLLVAACASDGTALSEDDPEKLLSLPAHLHEPSGVLSDNRQLDAEVQSRRNSVLREINRRNLGFFEQEVQRLDGWADDLKIGLEHEIREADREIKEVRRTAVAAVTLEEKLIWQKRQKELETMRNKLRRELFDRQDQIESQRGKLIASLEGQLQQEITEQVLFTIEWDLV